MKTTVYLGRHEVHGTEGVPKNTLAPTVRDRAKRAGVNLAKAGVKFDVAVSSPQPRAIETLNCVMQGIVENTPGSGMVPIRTYDEFGDATLGDFPFEQQEIASAVKKAAESGKSVEAVLLYEEEFRDKIKSRGEEGGQMLKWLMSPGKTMLIESHGGSRLEPIIAYLLKGAVVNKPVREGSFMVLTFEYEGEEPELVSVGYIETPSESVEAVPL